MATTTVMVVEDDPAFLARFCRIVAQSPTLSLLAAVGDLASARRAIDRQAPDVLLTDLGLPDGSGLSLGRHVRSRPHPPKSLIALSGFGAPSDVEASRQAGFDVHLTKPADIDRLLEILSAVPQ